jgi:hypothetical protein
LLVIACRGRADAGDATNAPHANIRHPSDDLLIVTISSLRGFYSSVPMVV